MKKFSILLAILLVFGVASQASALIFGDGYFVGTATPGGGNPDDEVAQVNYLIGLALGATATFDGDDYYRSLNDFGTMPTVNPDDVDDSDKQDNGNTSFDATGYEYVLGKYAAGNAGVAVWFNADGFDGEVTLPGTWYDTGQYGLSHTLGMDATTSVPEPATMGLLGLGLIGLVGLRRKIIK